MICVTGAERSLEALNARLTMHADAELQEVRLDHLEGWAPSFDRLPVDPRRLLFTCRPARQGGRFVGHEKERIRWLLHALRCRPGWVDLELDTDEALRRQLFRDARPAGTRILISAHETTPGSPAERRALVQRLAAANGEAAKLALMVEDAADLAQLQSAGAALPQPAVLVGQGPAGLLSRALYPNFGSVWTYASAGPGRETAPGQLSVAQMREWRLPVAPGADLYALLGGPGVMRSPGPAVYNALFAKRRLAAAYLPVITDRPAETLDLLSGLGLRGASVTMPLKERVTPLMDELGPEAQAAGVVNTITVAPGGRRRGDLTDGLGAVAALKAGGRSVAGKHTVILGSGGTAAAVARALVEADATVTILGRHPERAEALAARLGAAAGGDLADLAEVAFDILVNATPVGAADPETSPVSEPGLLAGKLVLDAVLTPDARLLRDTVAAGGTVIPGRRLWAEQGRRQLERWLGLRVRAATLEQDP